jgi:hypothetical protein
MASICINSLMVFVKRPLDGKRKLLWLLKSVKKQVKNIFDLLSSDILSCSTMMLDQVAIYNAVI